MAIVGVVVFGASRLLDLRNAPAQQRGPRSPVSRFPVSRPQPSSARKRYRPKALIRRCRHATARSALLKAQAGGSSTGAPE
jgi:hypothetical protein